MKTKNLMLLLLVSLFLLAGCAQVNPPQGCTQEARVCPDGSAVGRVGPNCTFAPCPNCTCPNGYIQEADVCNPTCYYSTPRCLMPSILCNRTQGNASVEGSSSVIDANNRFALELYSQYKSPDGNIFFSPYSISTALAMTYEGARGATADEMQSVLHFPTDNNTRRSGFAEIYSEINKKNKSYNLSTANALWAQKDFQFLGEYFSIVKTYYGGNVTNLDFAGDTENSRLTINKWVEDQTNDKIKNLIPQGVLTPLTRLVITNAVYFKARWRIPFLNKTHDEDFRISPSNTVKVKMMSLYGDGVQTSSGDYVPLRFNYTETEDAQIIELPYDGNETSMLILLPKGDDLTTLEQLLTAGKLNEWRAMLKETKLDGVYLPKFKFETKYFLPETLKRMGMKTAFDPNEADFSGMDGTKNLYISQVIHQAFIDVNETGTEAAAATAVVMTLGMAPGEPIIFRADHPFIFILQQKTTGNILFLGRISNPNES
ncbi:serpin family protein [Candidatus Micrarchaeota archaeon]|nr:serpin family protein [Candidatus Micrarchaeota archaeon]